MNPETQVYLNGKIVPSSEAHIAIYDASVVLGATLTDMERTFGHQLFRLDEHLDRFFRSCKYARIDPPISKGQTRKIVEELVHHNSQFIDSTQELGCFNSSLLVNLKYMQGLQEMQMIWNPLFVYTLSHYLFPFGSITTWKVLMWSLHP